MWHFYEPRIRLKQAKDKCFYAFNSLNGRQISSVPFPSSSSAFPQFIPDTKIGIIIIFDEIRTRRDESQRNGFCVLIRFRLAFLFVAVEDTYFGTVNEWNKTK